VNLPREFIEFLARGAALDFNNQPCELGEIRWHSLGALKTEEFRLQTYASPLESTDPNKDNDGAYLVPAISLIAESSSYLPHFLFSWLPEEEAFASGDEEHGHLWFLPGVSWQQIMENPIPYLEAQWNQDLGPGKRLCPWPRYPYVS
jgi:hypothetical protein